MLTESIRRVIQFPDDSFFLFGPRGSGKSRALKTAYPNATYIDLLKSAQYLRYLNRPDVLLEELRALPAGTRVVLDEIQRIPMLLNDVHSAIEELDLKFALCGSSSRKLKHAGVNLLAGRALSLRMFPFLPEELGSKFDLDEALRFGTLPLIWTAKNKKPKLKAYAQTYLREEVQAEALVRNLGDFARFLPVAALMHGQVLNAASLARDAGVGRTTVQNYIEILEDTQLAYRLYPLESQYRVKEQKHPKLYWIDAGIVRTLKNQWTEPSAAERGVLFEGFVAMVLGAYQSYYDLCDSLHYWATGDVEVDFILEKNGKRVAIEVKSGERVRKEDFSGLTQIAQLPGITRRILVHPAETARTLENGIEVLPAKKFFEELKSGQFEF